jgi:hypothetical protein
MEFLEYRPMPRSLQEQVLEAERGGKAAKK